MSESKSKIKIDHEPSTVKLDDMSLESKKYHESSAVKLDDKTLEIKKDHEPLAVKLDDKTLKHLDTFVNLRVKSESMMTPIAVATFKNNDLNLLKMLVQYGACVLIPDEGGRLPFELLPITAAKEKKDYLLAVTLQQCLYGDWESLACEIISLCDEHGANLRVQEPSHEFILYYKHCASKFMKFRQEQREQRAKLDKPVS